MPKEECPKLALHCGDIIFTQTLGNSNLDNKSTIPSIRSGFTPNKVRIYDGQTEILFDPLRQDQESFAMRSVSICDGMHIVFRPKSNNLGLTSLQIEDLFTFVARHPEGWQQTLNFYVFNQELLALQHVRQPNKDLPPLPITFYRDQRNNRDRAHKKKTGLTSLRTPQNPHPGLKLVGEFTPIDTKGCESRGISGNTDRLTPLPSLTF